LEYFVTKNLFEVTAQSCIRKVLQKVPFKAATLITPWLGIIFSVRAQDCRMEKNEGFCCVSGLAQLANSSHGGWYETLTLELGITSSIEIEITIPL
jgi:hypothetical protein